MNGTQPPPSDAARALAEERRLDAERPPLDKAIDAFETEKEAHPIARGALLTAGVVAWLVLAGVLVNTCTHAPR